MTAACDGRGGRGRHTLPTITEQVKRLSDG